jgi:carbon storage regulator
MLVLSRKAGERIRIGDNITIVVNRVVGSRVSVGIEAPANVRIVRGELEFYPDEPLNETPVNVAACPVPLASDHAHAHVVD